jgi:hypothetical protein
VVVVVSGDSVDEVVVVLVLELSVVVVVGA